MEINKELADGIKIETNEFEIVYAKKKENANTKFVEELWVKKNIP